MSELPNIFISTPLEEEHVERIRSVAGNRAVVHYEPDLLPPTRYISDHGGVEDFVRTPEQQERWRMRLAEAEFLWDVPPLRSLPDWSPETPMAWAPNLRWVQTTSSGVGVLVKSLRLAETDVTISTARGVHAEPLSEFALMAILMHFRKLLHLQVEQAAHRWTRYCGEGLSSKSVLIVGTGEIGHRTAVVCKGMGMSVLATSRSLKDEEGAKRGYDRVFPFNELTSALAEADAVVICLPHTTSTENLFGASAFAAMKPDAVLVNIGRGKVIDEDAMIEALQKEQIGFAALDVTAIEPLPEDSPLWDLSNVLISPHSASTVLEENRRITDIFVHNLECLLGGRPDDLRNVFDKSQLD